MSEPLTPEQIEYLRMLGIAPKLPKEDLPNQNTVNIPRDQAARLISDLRGTDYVAPERPTEMFPVDRTLLEQARSRRRVRQREEEPVDWLALIQGTAEGGTFGFSDEIAGGLGAAYSSLLKTVPWFASDILEAARSTGMRGTDEEILERILPTYREVQQMAAQQNREAAEASPGEYLGGIVGGSLLTGRLTTAASPAATSVNQGMASGAARGLAEGALWGAGTSETNPIENPKQFVEDVGRSAVVAGGLGGFIGGTSAGLAARAARPDVRIARVARQFGMSVDDINELAVQNRLSPSEIVGRLEELRGPGNLARGPNVTARRAEELATARRNEAAAIARADRNVEVPREATRGVIGVLEDRLANTPQALPPQARSILRRTILSLQESQGRRPLTMGRLNDIIRSLEDIPSKNEYIAASKRAVLNELFELRADAVMVARGAPPAVAPERLSRQAEVLSVIGSQQRPVSGSGPLASAAGGAGVGGAYGGLSSEEDSLLGIASDIVKGAAAGAVAGPAARMLSGGAGAVGSSLRTGLRNAPTVATNIGEVITSAPVAPAVRSVASELSRPPVNINVEVPPTEIRTIPSSTTPTEIRTIPSRTPQMEVSDPDSLLREMGFELEPAPVRNPTTRRRPTTRPSSEDPDSLLREMGFDLE